MRNIITFLLLPIHIILAQNSLDTIIQLNEVNATFKATGSSPVNYQNISKQEIKQKSIGQEPAMLISNTPSITYSVDGGHTQGYSYFRLRGLDQTRVNITIDGIPLNDPMDQAFYFSNFADILNSVDDIQIQRGAGVTKNGNASYAGSIELFSEKLSSPENYHFGLGYGSFNTLRTFASFNSGIKKNKALNVRISKIYSDGYKDHSSNNSQSIHINAGLFLDKSIWKFSVLGGNQENELSWMAVPESDINCLRTTNANSPHEKDDFSQLITKIQNTFLINSNTIINSTLYYNLANGWWNFDLDNYYGDTGYGITKNEINSHLLGFFSNYEYLNNSMKLNFGMHGNAYQNNFLEIDAISNSIFNDVDRFKKEISAFSKIEYRVRNLLFSADIQYRQTSFDYDSEIMDFKEISWNFLNPKFGISYETFNNGLLYVSLARIGREPAKYDMFQGNDILYYIAPMDTNFNYIIPQYGNDLIDTRAEFVNNIELGIRKSFTNGTINLNYFYMDFKNERVLNGQTGPSGLALRSRVDNSIRTGLEFFSEYYFNKNLKITNNSSYNYSKVLQDEIEFIPILTPKLIINQEFSYSLKNFTINLSARYQSQSYINFENSESLNDYFIINGRIDYKFKNYFASFFVNNITDNYYFNNGSINSDSWDYIPDGTRTLYVQAPRNLYVSIGCNF